MAQFFAYENLNPGSRRNTPYLLDVQSNLLAELGTRVVVPLHKADFYRGQSLSVLMPALEIEGLRVIAVVQELAGVPARLLGREAADLTAHRSVFITALDFLVSGV
jgi:toxin CcdB